MRYVRPNATKFEVLPEIVFAKFMETMQTNVPYFPFIDRQRDAGTDYYPLISIEEVTSVSKQCSGKLVGVNRLLPLHDERMYYGDPFEANEMVKI